MAANPIADLALIPEENAKLTPLEILADFADATRGWVYLERASRHYAHEKDQPALVLRHYRDGHPSHVDIAFATVPGETERLDLVILDAPDANEPLSKDAVSTVLETFLDAVRTYLSERGDHVTLEVDRDRPDPATS